LWDGNGPLHFSKVFAPEELAFESPKGQAPIPLYASVRKFGILNLVAPSVQSPFLVTSEDYGFSTKVEKPFTQQDVFALFRTQYEGTEFDLTQGILAGPYGNPFRSEGGPKFGQIPRGVAITRTVYSIVCQTGPKRQMAWFASDAPTTSVYVPLFARAGAVSKPYSTGHNQEFTRASASWAFNFVNNYMQLNYHDMSVNEVYPAIKKWQDHFDGQLAEWDAMTDKEELARAQIQAQEDVVASWWKLADFIVMKYNDGKINWPKAGVSIGYPEQFSRMIGFSNDVHPLWVQPAVAPTVAMDGYIPSSAVMPSTWHSETATWTYALSSTQSAAAQPDSHYPMVAQLFLTSLVGGLGIIVGRIIERRQASSAAPYLLMK